MSIEKSSTYKFLPPRTVLPIEPSANPKGSVEPREANQTMTSYFGFVTLVDWSKLGSRKKSRVTSALTPRVFKPLTSRVFVFPVPLGYMAQVALTSSAVMFESIIGRVSDLDLTFA